MWLSPHAIQAQARVLGPQLLRAASPTGSPFVALIDNNASGAALLAAAEQCESNCVLLPRGLAHIAGDVARRTGASACLEVGADGNIEASVPASMSSSSPRRAAVWHTHPATVGGGGTVVLLTSGSGPLGPKFPAYTWQACRAQASETVRRLALSPADGFICASSIGHAYNMNGFFTALAAETPVGLAANAAELRELLQGRAEAEMCMSNDQNEEDGGRVVLFATPRMYEQLAAEMEQQGPPTLGRELHAYSAGCPLPRDVRARVEAALGVRLRQNYGSSETGNIALCWSCDDAEAAQRIGDVEEGVSVADVEKGGGLAVVGPPWGDIHIAGTTKTKTSSRASSSSFSPAASLGADLPGGCGEISVRMAWQSLGYVQDRDRAGTGTGTGTGTGIDLVEKEAQLHLHPDGRVWTGDAGRLVPCRRADSDALLLGRRLRRPIRPAVQPHEAEAALEGHPLVVAAAVCPIPDDARVGRSDVVVMVAVGDADVTTGDIQAWCAEHQQKHLAPLLPEHEGGAAEEDAGDNDAAAAGGGQTHWIVVEELPKSPAGKILHSKIVQQVQGEEGRIEK